VGPKANFSRSEALVRKRESLLKFIYERRKGEVFSDKKVSFR